MTPPEEVTMASTEEEMSGHLQLVCKNVVRKKGATLLLRLKDPPQVMEQVALLTEVQPLGGSWKQALIVRLI
jgi:hypothetical protein